MNKVDPFISVLVVNNILLLIMCVFISTNVLNTPVDALEMTTEPTETIVSEIVESSVKEPVYFEGAIDGPITKETEPEPETTVPDEIVDTTDVKLFNVPMDRDLQIHILELCEDYDVDPAIIMAMIDRESDFRAHLMGDSGRSYGLMQIMLKWHVERMNKLGVTDLLDPYQNVAVGIDYLAELLNYGGKERSIEWALMAYNGGPDYANRKAAAGVVTDYAISVIENSTKLERV